ncbi:MAG: hypothetical protein ACJ72W_28150 [Actinoallomurus sp.]
MRTSVRRAGIAALGLLLVAPLGGGQALARPKPAAATGTVGGFSFGQLQDQTVGASGCGTNVDGEPSAHVSKANLVEVGSEEGVGGGSELWRVTQVGGSPSADACQPVYAGQPNAVSKGVGLSGGDIDTAFAPVKSSSGTYRLYVASLNLGSINVAVSNDDGKTFTQTPVQTGVPVDDREWIAAYGADTSLLTYHDISTDNIDVLRSDNGGRLYTQTATAIPASDYKAGNNELGNIAIDHVNSSPTAGGFWAYQSFVAPSTSSGSTFDEAFLAVSSDGGHSWTDKPIPCTTAFGANGLGHNFPNVSVAPNGTLFYAVSNDTSVYVASSSDHGDTWTCSGPVSTPAHAVFPWIVATSAGEDLVYYGSPTSGNGQTWYVYFAQNPTQSVSGWTTSQLMPVHTGPICEGGISCTGGRQLLDDFAVDTDQSGWAHIAYSHDAPDLGGSGSYTGYAVQQSGTPAGAPN